MVWVGKVPRSDEHLLIPPGGSQPVKCRTVRRLPENGGRWSAEAVEAITAFPWAPSGEAMQDSAKPSRRKYITKTYVEKYGATQGVQRMQRRRRSPSPAMPGSLREDLLEGGAGGLGPCPSGRRESPCDRRGSSSSSRTWQQQLRQQRQERQQQ